VRWHIGGAVTHIVGATDGIGGSTPANGPTDDVVIVGQMTVAWDADACPTAVMNFAGHSQDRSSPIDIADMTPDWSVEGVQFNLC
jgi:hypothetical protein